MSASIQSECENLVCYRCRQRVRELFQRDGVKVCRDCKWLMIDYEYYDYVGRTASAGTDSGTKATRCT